MEDRTMKDSAEKSAAAAKKEIKALFAALPIEDKVKVIDSLAGPIKRQVDKVIRDTYDPDFGGCSEFFIEDSYVYYNSPTDNKLDRFMTACSYGQDNISFPLRWLDEGCDYKAEYRKICDDEEARDKARLEAEEKDELRRLISKYGRPEQ